MDEKANGRDSIDRLTAQRVDQMSEAARAELARELAGPRRGVTDEGFRRRRRLIALPGRQGAAQPDAEVAAIAARLTADLQRTERRLARLDRSNERGRYQIGVEGPPTGRYARLVRRAERLERQLRDLR